MIILRASRGYGFASHFLSRDRSGWQGQVHASGARGGKPRFAPCLLPVSMSSRVSQIVITRSPRRDRRCLSVSHHRWIGPGSSGSPRGGGKSWPGGSTRRSGPSLDLDADDIEQMAATAARAVARGTIADLLERKAALLGPEQPCPTCRRPCAVGASRGRSTSGAARSPTPSPSATARPAAGIFFPQRPALRLTPHDYSPSVLRKVVRSAAREPSFREAAEAVADLAEVTISGRQLDRIAQRGRRAVAGRAG